jgi:hypothetical protein
MSVAATANLALTGLPMAPPTFGNMRGRRKPEHLGHQLSGEDQVERRHLSADGILPIRSFALPFASRAAAS